MGTHDAAFDADLLVVGLGPAGDVLAGLAHLAGVSVIAIDAADDIYPMPRAAVFDAEVMRIFQMLGTAETIAPLCRVPDRYQFVTADDQILLDFEIAARSPQSGWADNYLLHQPAVESALRNRLTELGVDIRQRTTWLDMAQDADGVTSRVEGPGGVNVLRTRYAVGCDGASSAVRTALGASLFDYGFDEPWLVIDVIAKAPHNLPQRLMQICDPKRPVTYMKMCGDRYRWEFMIKPDEDPVEVARDENIIRLLAPWVAADAITVERKAVYRFHGLLAEQWRQGRVLLAGDAAHQMPPFAGQGMCASIRDAANLAWKLGEVVSGRAPERLLDTYQVEREPHVRAVIETAIAMGRVVCLLDENAAADRNAGMLARKAAGQVDIALAFPDLTGGMLTTSPGAGTLFPQLLSTVGKLDDQLGRGAWLIGERHSGNSADHVRSVGLDDPVLAPFAADLSAWLSERNASAVLVRPDRHVFGTGSAAHLMAQWQTMLTGQPADKQLA